MQLGCFRAALRSSGVACLSVELTLVQGGFILRVLYHLCIAQWLERPLRVRKAGVRSPTASH